MSEFLAEARVLVTPDTTRFRAELVAELTAVTRGVVVPVSVVPTVSGAAAAAAAAQAEASTAAAAAIAQQTAALQAAAAASTRLAVALEATNLQMGKQVTAAQALGASQRRATVATHEATTAQAQFRKGLIASAASATGLRGAVLAASSPFLIAAVSAAAFTKAVQSAAQLETELNVFRVTAGATADEMSRVGAQAKALGRDLTLPGVTAADAAQTFLQLARAGLTVQESLDGARGVLQLAVAAEVSFADAAQITASALNAFALQGEQAVNVADLLTNAANASQASISDMGIALRQSAAIADLAGFSLSETVTFLTQLARAGLAGSDAGTSFRVSIQRLIAPTGAARRALERLNINLRDAAGNLRPEAFFELGRALEGMGRAQGDATRQIIFGNDASRAAAFFARINAEAFRDQEGALQRQGAAAEVAGARNEGFAGSVENLKNQLSALGIQLGEIAIPPLTVTVDALATSFGFLADTVANNRKFLSDMADSLGEDAAKIEEFADAAGLGEADLQSFFDNVAQGAGVFKSFSDSVDDSVRSFLGLGGAANQADPPIRKLRKTENELAVEVTEANRRLSAQADTFTKVRAEADSLATSISRLANQQKGLEEQTTRARIAGDEGGELASLRARRENLEAELRAQEEIIARPGLRGEATARAAVRQRILPQLEAVSGEIERILQAQQSRAEDAQRDRESAQEELLRARSEADRQFLDRLSERRGDAERRVSAAAETEGITDDIRRQNQLQRLIKQQIQKIRDRISDEQARKAAIRELRLALIASRQEEDALREQQKLAVQARIDEVQNLNIAIAEERGNDAALARAINARITRLNKQIKAAKGDQVKVKELILERERLKNQLEKGAEQEKQTGKSAQQFFFEQLQAQQGFASNLLGNLIRGPTAGLVGVPPPPLGDIKGAVSIREGKDTRGPTAGQASTANDLLHRILEQLKTLNGADANPEAKRQRQIQHASMDTVYGV